ncbi:hypothetical protein N7504_010629 [Penicillium tannophilum]|nr:hypothetical protein N7504_010629 [Penicillium tannophilum]
MSTTAGTVSHYRARVSLLLAVLVHVPILVLTSTIVDPALPLHALADCLLVAVECCSPGSGGGACVNGICISCPAATPFCAAAGICAISSSGFYVRTVMLTGLLGD